MDPLQPTEPDYDFKPLTPEQKQKKAEQNKRGLLWMGIGSAILAISFRINFIFLYSEMDFRPAMYAMTIIGSIMLIKGMTDIFGWK